VKIFTTTEASDQDQIASSEEVTDEKSKKIPKAVSTTNSNSNCLFSFDKSE
jgi:hypothetical protein